MTACAASINSVATGLSVRFFKVVIPTGYGKVQPARPKSVGNKGPWKTFKRGQAPRLIDQIGKLDLAAAGLVVLHSCHNKYRIVVDYGIDDDGSDYGNRSGALTLISLK
jgi:hypothetical protein